MVTSPREAGNQTHCEWSGALQGMLIDNAPINLSKHDNQTDYARSHPRLGRQDGRN